MDLQPPGKRRANLIATTFRQCRWLPPLDLASGPLSTRSAQAPHSRSRPRKEQRRGLLNAYADRGQKDREFGPGFAIDLMDLLTKPSAAPINWISGRCGEAGKADGGFDLPISLRTQSYSQPQ